MGVETLMESFLAYIGGGRDIDVIRSAIMLVIQSEGSAFLNLVSFSEVFSFFVSPSCEEPVDMCNFFALLCKDSMGATLVQSVSDPNLLRAGLLHVSECVRNAVLAQVEKVAGLDVLDLDFLITRGVVCLLLRMVGDHEASLALRASNLLLKLSERSESVVDSIVATERSDTDDQDPSVHFRLLDFFCSLALQSERASLKMIEVGALQEVVRLYSTSDMLLKANIVELVCALSKKPFSVQYLISSNVPRMIAADIMSSGVVSTTKCSLLAAASGMFEMVDKVAAKAIFHSCAMMLTADESDVRESSLAAFVSILRTPLGISEAWTYKDHYVIKILFGFIHGADQVLKVGGLHAIASVLEVQNAELSQTQEQIFDELCVPESHFSAIFDSPVDKPVHSYRPFLSELLRAPFPDVRGGVFHVLETASPHVWAVNRFAQWSGFVEFLLDRSTEHEKAGVEWKYGIVCSILKTAETQKTELSARALAELRSYQAAGVYPGGHHASVIVDTQSV